MRHARGPAAVFGPLVLLAGCDAAPPAAPPAGPAGTQRAPEFVPPAAAAAADRSPGDPPRFYPSGSPVTMRRKRNVAPPKLLLGHNADVFDVAVSPDGRFVYTVSLDGTARSWNLAAGLEVRRHAFPSFGLIHPTPGAVAVSRDGRRLFTASRGPGAAVRALDPVGGAVRWATQVPDPPLTPREIGPAYEADTTTFWDLAVAPDGLTLYAAADDTVRTFAAADGAEGRRFVPPPPPAGTPEVDWVIDLAGPPTVRVRRLALSGDGDRLAAVCLYDWTDPPHHASAAWEWDLTAPDGPPAARGPRDVPFRPFAVAYDPRGTLIVAGARPDRPGGEEGFAYTDEGGGRWYGGPLPSTAEAGDFAVTPDGLYAITGGSAASASATMLTNRFPTHDLPGPRVDYATLPVDAHLWGSGLSCVAVTPGGRLVVAGTEGGAVLVWDAFEPE